MMASGTLAVIFIPPLYFALRKKWGAFTLNAILYGLVCIFLLSIIGAFIARIFWSSPPGMPDGISGRR